MLHLPLPRTTARCLLALGVTDSRCDPFTVFLIVPFLRLLGVWVRDGLGFIVKPAFRLGRLIIRDFVWCILIPVTGLYEKTTSDIYILK